MNEIKLADIDIYKIGTTIQLAGALWSGDGKNFLCIFPQEILGDDFSLLRMARDEWQRFLRQSDLQETEVLQHGLAGPTKAILRKSQRQIDAHVMWAVFRRDNYTCRYCGNNQVPLTIDHIVLWEEGGPTIDINLLSACKNCNKARGNMLYEEWVVSKKYLALSKNLSPEVRRLNLEKIKDLPTIEKVKNIRSR